MKKKCRIKITLKCNKRCGYCINKNKAYRRKWKKARSWSDIPYGDYRSIVISGGEPTLVAQDVVSLASCIRAHTDAPIYLQTNGKNLTKRLVRD